MSARDYIERFLILRKRRVHPIVTGASLALAISTAVVWERSARIYDVIAWWGANGRGVAIESAAGELRIERRNVFPGDVVEANLLGLHHLRDDFEGTMTEQVERWLYSSRRVPGVLYYRVRWADCEGEGIVISYYPAFLLFLVLPARLVLVLYLNRRWRQRMVQTKHCPRCGYDLRASPERCPECGHDNPRRTAYLRAEHDRQLAARLAQELSKRLGQGRKTGQGGKPRND